MGCQYSRQPKNVLSSVYIHEICLPIADDKKMFALCRTGVLCSPAESDLTILGTCSHGKADTHMLPKGIKKVGIRTVDTDVVVNINPGELWISLGT